jgi:hypothetical protein
MATVRVTLKRSPRTIAAGGQVLEVVTACDSDEQMTASVVVTEDCLPAYELEDASATGAATSSQPLTSAPEPASTHAPPVSGDRSVSVAPIVPNTAAGSTVATVLTDLSNRVVTPFAQSAAVPVWNSPEHLAGMEKVAEPPAPMISDEDLSDLRNLLEQAVASVDELQQQHRQSLQEMQEVAVELALAAASALTGAAIDRGQFAVDDLILQALDQMQVTEPVRVRMNPLDHELLQALMKAPEASQVLKSLTVIQDDGLNRGSCRVESGRRILLTDLQSRLDDIRRSWMEKLDDSQIERRGDGSTGRSLRRFPDRREASQRARTDAS